MAEDPRSVAAGRRTQIAKLLEGWEPAGRVLVDGRWNDPRSGQLRDAVDPATGETLIRAADGSEADVDAAVAAAERTREARSWAMASPFERARVLRRIAAAVAEQSETLALLESADTGKPLDNAKGDVESAAAWFDYYASLAVNLEGSTRHLDQGIALIRREPVGTVGIITPFNFPIALSSVKIAPALAAGCSVVHKPSQHTPLTALAIGQLALEAGLPPGLLNVVTGGAATGSALVRHPRVAKIVFTGSTAVGQQVAAEASQTIKRVTMELGGKSANIVCADADLATALPRSHFAYTMNAGQYCEAGSRLLVDARVHDEVVEGLAREAGRAKVGDPLEPESEVGPLITPAATERVHALVARSVEAGAELVTGDPSVGDRGSYFAPTVIAGAAVDSEIARTELFGPVVTVLPFGDVEEAIAIANGTPFGLAAGVQTADLGRGIRLAERLEAGTVWINDWATGNLTIPVGGWKQSGIGREGGPEGLAGYLEYKSILATL